MRIACKAAAFALTLSTMTPLSLDAQTKPDASQLISALSGTWKEDQAKRKFGSTPGLRFRTTASGGLEELRGPEATPMVQDVKLDGKSYEMESGNSMIWKQIDANTFERKTAHNSKPMSVRHIRISDDGKTLTEDSERFSVDGSSRKNTAEYRRETGSGKGLAGTWRIIKMQGESIDIKYEPVGKDAVKVTNPIGQSYMLFFDGKTSPVTGGNVIPGMAISAKQIDGHTMETTSTRGGVKAATSRIVLSEGNKVMTVTTTPAAPNSGREPSVVVFAKK